MPRKKPITRARKVKILREVIRTLFWRGLAWEIERAPELERDAQVLRGARQVGGKQKAAKLRRRALKDLRAFEAFKSRRGDKLSDKAAARLYLAEHGGDAWPCDTDEERERKVASFLRRMSTARKNRRR